MTRSGCQICAGFGNRHDPIAHDAEPTCEHEHADVAVPGKCGDCKDQREANRTAADRLPDYRLVVVPPLCGKCDERWIETPSGLAKCPNCYPRENVA